MRPPITDDLDGLLAACDRISNSTRPGRLAEATTELSQRLALVDAHTAPADDRLLNTALLHLRTATPSQAHLQWAMYAHRAALLLHGETHPHTLEAADRLADVLRAHHCIAAATELRRTLTAHFQHHGPADQHAHARLALAQVLHANGDCDNALQQADIVLYAWAPHHQPALAHGPVLLLHVLRLIEACGLTTTAQETLHAYRQLLTTNKPLAAAHLARQLLGDLPVIRQHRSICGADHGLLPGRHRRPHPANRLRGAVLKQLTGDPHFGESVTPPTTTAPVTAQTSDTWASPGLRAAVLTRYTNSGQTVNTIADRLGYPPIAIVAVLAAAGIHAEPGQPNLYQHRIGTAEH